MRVRHHLFGRWFFLFILGSIALEIGWYLLIRRRAYPWRETATTVGVYLLRLPMRLLAPAIVAPISFLLWSWSPFRIPYDTIWGLVLLFLAEELAYYWMHRSSHQIRWLWASHVVHHTPEHLHLASAFRLGATELFSGNWLFHLPLYLLGLNPVAVAAMSGLNLSYQFLLHTEAVGKLGALEWVLNTPSHHRVHHASNPEYVDRNYGGMVIIWDRLFGTFAEERLGTDIVYGLSHPFHSANPLRVAFHEWLALLGDTWRARSWPERLRQLFGRPRDSLAARGAPSR